MTDHFFYFRVTDDCFDSAVPNDPSCPLCKPTVTRRVVYYANFLVWFEIAGVDLLRQLGFDYKKMETEDDIMPVVDVACRYKAPAHYDDQIVIETRITAMRTSMMKFTYEVYCAGAAAEDGSLSLGKLLASGETTPRYRRIRNAKDNVAGEVRSGHTRKTRLDGENKT